MDTLATKLTIPVIHAFEAAYNDACNKGNYKLCDSLRAELNRMLSGNPGLIKIENSLNLPPFLF